MLCGSSSVISLQGRGLTSSHISIRSRVFLPVSGPRLLLSPTLLPDSRWEGPCCTCYGWESSLIPEECSSLSAYTGHAGLLGPLGPDGSHHPTPCWAASTLLVLLIMDL